MSGCLRTRALDISPAGVYSSSTVSWTQVLPAGGAISVTAALDGENFSAVSNGGAIPGLSASDDLTGVTVTFKIELTAGTGNVSPELSGFEVSVVGTGAALTQPTNRYNFGQLKWTSGSNKDDVVEVKRWDASTRQVVLFLPMLDAIQAGDTFEIYPGCNKSAADCSTFFNNIVNFRGEPYVPGQDEYQRYPDTPTG